MAYNWWQARQKADPFQLIPESAVAVIETKEFYSNWENIQGSAFWKNIQGLPFASHINEKMHYADSLVGAEKLAAFFHGRKILSSLHVISNYEADYIFYIPVENAGDEEMISRMFVGMKGWNPGERTYEGITIKEFTKPGEKISFSAIRYRNLLIASYTAFLIEDVIRIIKEERAGNFLKNNPEVKNPAHSHSDAYIYLNYKNISAYVSLFANIQAHDFLKPLGYFAEYSVLDYKMNKKEIVFDGFTRAKKDTHFLGIFAGQKPQKFNVKSYVPNNTGMLYYYGFDDGVKLNESLNSFWQKHDPSLIEKRTRMNEQLGVDVNELYPEFGNEAALCFVKPLKAFHEQGKLLFVESVNADKFFLKLNKFVTIMKEGRRDTLLYEKQGDHLIREMNIPEFPSLILGDLFSGFSECYYTRINNYIVFSDDAQNLRELFVNIDSENVWGKSAETASFIDNHFSPSNVSLFINTSQAWKQLMGSSSSEVKQIMQDNPDVLKKISPILFQFNIFQDKIYTSIVLKHALDKELQQDNYNYEPGMEFQTEQMISSILYVNKAEGLVQDSSNSIYLINMNGIRWKISVQSQVTGKVISADLDKNRIKDFVFVAGNKIYAYDTAGKALTHFPVALPDSIVLSGLSLADYEGDGNYRILANDRNGNVYIVDAKGKRLPDWNPKKMPPLTSPLRHVRVKGKDYFIAMQKDAKLSVLNRRGETYKGFPVVFGKSSSSPVFIEAGSTPEKTFIHVLTDEGNFIKINLLAEVVEKASFPDKRNEKYKLLTDQKEAGFVIAARSGDQLAIMNSSGKEVFQVNIPEAASEINYRHMKEMNAVTIYSEENNLSSFYLFDDQWKNILKLTDLHGRMETGQMRNDILVFRSEKNILKTGSIQLNKASHVK
jgi:hypothetical protein